MENTVFARSYSAHEVTASLVGLSDLTVIDVLIPVVPFPDFSFLFILNIISGITGMAMAFSVNQLILYGVMG